MKHLRKYNEGYSEATISEIISKYEAEIADLLEEQQDNTVERFIRGERDDSPYMPSTNDYYMAGESKGRLETLQELVVILKSL